MTDNLKKIVEDLISLGKEGDYWDFKEVWHHNNADFVRDIISLANTTHHNGQRYLVFGVSGDFKVVGVDSQKIKKQADIISILRDCGFAGGVFPDVELVTVKIDQNDLNVIVINDKTEERPYYLEKLYECTDNQGPKKSTIYPGTIYSRIRDSNTPKNSVASSGDIEKMWRQRFGLDGTPLERMTQYLLDFEGWDIPIKDYKGKDFADCSLSGLLDKNEIVHYKQHPEFTIRKSPLCRHDENGLGDKVDAGESWVRHALDPISYMYKLELMYHQTVLHTEEALTYDGAALFSNPRTRYKLKNVDGALFYYYMESDSLRFNILRFLHPYILDHTSEIVNPRRSGRLPLVIFKNEEELEQFCDYLDSQFELPSIKNIEFYQDKAYDLKNKPQDTLNIQLCLFVKEQLLKWRNNHD